VCEIELSHIQLDALREISSIGGGHAATSLSVMVGKKVTISTPIIMVETAGKIPEALGGEEAIVSVVYFSVSGHLSGSILLMFSVPESLRLANVLIGQKVGEIKEMDEMGISALKEIGNITVGTYLRALGKALKLRVTYSIPGFACDMLGALLDGTLAVLSLKTECLVIAENQFIVEKDVYKGYIVFILEPNSLHVMLKALGTRAT
jgi:chemotaxis protein CheC